VGCDFFTLTPPTLICMSVRLAPVVIERGALGAEASFVVIVLGVCGEPAVPVCA
jgi:hypothetical protein